MQHHLRSFVLAAAAAFATASAAADFSFTLGGFSGGGTLSGSFSGNDDDGNGLVSTLDPGAEVTAFALSWSGDAAVGAFQAGLPELTVLVFRPGGGPLLGDDTLPYAEGLGVTSGARNVLAGLGAYGETGAIVTDLDLDVSSLAAQPVAVVPEPATWLLWAAALGAAGVASRRAARP